MKISRIASEAELQAIKDIKFVFHENKKHRAWLKKRLINKLPKAIRNIYYPKPHRRKGYINR